jgi:hypothetical protein
MKRTLIIALISIATASLTAAAVTTSFEFTSAEGFAEGVTLNGTANWITQTQWVARDVAGAGNAFSGTDFTRAVLFNNNTWNVGDSYTLVAKLTLIDSSFVNTKTNMFQFGLTDIMNPGSNTPKAGMTVRPAFANFFIDANIAVGGHEVDTGVGKDNNSHTYTTVITKSSTADTFNVSIDFDNGTAGKSFTIVNASLYAATTVYPIIDNSQANTKGGIQVDSFSSTFTAVPEPGTVALCMGTAALGLVLYRRKKLEQ